MRFLTDIDFNKSVPEYRLTLTKMNEEPIMSITNIQDLVYKPALNGIDELSFSIPYYREDNEGNKVENERYAAINGDMLVLLNDEQYFYINYIKEEVESDGNVIKEIQALSREFELSQKKIMGYKGMSRRIYTMPVGGEAGEKDEDGLYIGFLNYVESISSWRVGYVDNDIMNKYRTLEFNDSNILNALQEVQRSFGCFFHYDTKHRKINVYKASDFEGDQGLYISDKNFLESLSKNFQSDNIKTRLYLYGKDNISIQSINITGKPYIENFSYYKNTDFMSKELIHALDNYEEAIDSEKGVYNTLLQNINKLNQELRVVLDSLVEANNEVKESEILLDTIIARPYESNEERNKALALQREEISKKEKVVASITIEKEQLKKNINKNYDKIRELQERLSAKAFLPWDLAKELDSFIKEDSYSDSNYEEDSIEELYVEGTKILNRISQPEIQFDVEVVDFLTMVEAQHSWNKLRLGDSVHLFHNEINFDYTVRLVGYEHNPDSSSLTLHFSSTGTLDDPSLFMRDLLDEFKTTSSSVDFSRYKWDKGESAETAITQYIDNNLDLAKQALETANGQVTLLDHRGYWGTKLNEDGTESPEKIRMTNNLIAMTKDDWQTVDVAISPTLGINANLINGQIGNFATINANQILAGRLESTNHETWIDLDNGEFNFKQSLIWGEKGLSIKGHLVAGTVNIGEKFKVDNKGNMFARDALFEGDIKGASTITIGERFSVDQMGNMIAKNASFSGEIVGASSIAIGEKFFVDRYGNMTAKSAELSGNLNAGTININDNFTVDRYGRMTAKNGVFKGRMEAVDIQGGKISIGRNFYVSEDGNLNASNARFEGEIRGSSIAVGGGKYSFSVDTDGEMRAVNATFEGEIKSSVIKGGQITGSFLRTADVDEDRLELTKTSLTTYDKNNNRHGIELDIGNTHNSLSIYDRGSRKGVLEYTTDSFDSYLDDKLWLRSDFNVPLKIQSGPNANMSIASSRTIYFDAQEMHFSAVGKVSFLTPAKFADNGAYTGNVKTNSGTLKIVNGFVVGIF